MPIDLVEGWTARLEWQLKKDSVVMNLTGLSACALIKDERGNDITTTCADGTVVITASCGHVGIWPTSTGMFSATASPYKLRFKITDMMNGVVFFPSGREETITVFSQ